MLVLHSFMLTENHETQFFCFFTGIHASYFHMTPSYPLTLIAQRASHHGKRSERNWLNFLHGFLHQTSLQLFLLALLFLLLRLRALLWCCYHHGCDSLLLFSMACYLCCCCCCCYQRCFVLLLLTAAKISLLTGKSYFRNRSNDHSSF